MRIVLEEVNRNKKVLQRHRFSLAEQNESQSKSNISIGRALDNDLILNEPHVSPHHLQISLNDQGKMVLTDLNSENGIRSINRREIPSGSIVNSGDVFLLGRSYVRVWDDQHPVEPAWKLHGVEDFFYSFSSIGAVLVLLFMFVASKWQISSMNNYADIPFSIIMQDLITSLMVIVGWASLWSLGGRMLRHDGRFLGHCSVTLLAAICIHWFPVLIKWLLFNLQLGLWMPEARYFFNGAVLSLLLWSNFYLALPQKPNTRIIWANSIAWGLVLIYILPPIFDKNSFRGYPRYDSLLMPSSAVWANPEDINRFIQRGDELFKSHNNELKD